MGRAGGICRRSRHPAIAYSPAGTAAAYRGLAGRPGARRSSPRMTTAPPASAPVYLRHRADRRERIERAFPMRIVRHTGCRQSACTAAPWIARSPAPPAVGGAQR